MIRNLRVRILGHPVHVMLIHFPVALWPAHECLHLFASHLPSGAATSVGFWLLVVGIAFGWLAAIFGLTDLMALWRENDPPPLSNGVIHAFVNGSTLVGFTVILVLEYSVFPAIAHGVGFLTGEAALIIAMFVGNYFGGAVIWHRPAQAP